MTKRSVAKPELTAKQEAFAVAWVELGSASEAYRRTHDVGAETKPESIWSAASRCLGDVKVQSRIKELQAEARDLMLISVGTLTDRLEQARLHAMKDEKGASAAVSATMGMAKLHGLLVDKAEVTGKDGKELVPEVDGRDLARTIAFALAAGQRASAE
ncbi:terminase small subunit [Mesorhizobium sp. M1322]|uniref:terminase small subunit n=1 Tax=Mesorhizobium sp. M1322 TaxID=2957081 RepID=UPI00333B9DC0